VDFTPLVLFLLACATVYLGTVQAAFSAMMRLSLRLVAERSGRSNGLGHYLDDPLLLFIPARILQGGLLVAATVLIARLTSLSVARTYVIASIVGAVFIIIFNHLIPLLIIRLDPERVLEVLLPSFSTIIAPLRPLTRALIRLSEVRTPPGVTVPTETAGEEGEAAEAYLEAGVQEGLIEKDERRLLQSIVDFGDTLVREVMTPRPDIVAIRSDATHEELLAVFKEQEYSRIPVYKENLDNILGFVFVKDLIQREQKTGVTSVMRPAYFVPETKRVSDLLKEFQRQQVQSAIVVDEYGGTAGLVTIEDLLEEIVGEIRDEYDVESEPIVDEGQGRFVFSGKVDIDEVADRLNLEIEREGFETLGGYLLAHLGRVPAVGERFDIDGVSVEVLEAERRRVHKVRMTLQPVRAGAPDHSGAGSPGGTAA
jgi:magnesium and cobalt exporter, CNNM family